MRRVCSIIAMMMLGAKAMATPMVSGVQAESPRCDSNLPPAVFGGTGRKFDLNIAGIDMQNGTLRTKLFAVAGGLAVPVQQQSSVVTGVNLPGRVEVPVSFPQVKNETDMVFELSAVAAGSPNPIPLTKTVFCVYPHDIDHQIEALLPALPNGDNRLVVFGSGHDLKTALHAMHVPFSDSGSDLPGRFLPDQIYLGDVATREAEMQAHDRSKGARLGVFAVDNSLPSGIYVDRSPDGAYILATVHILSTLADNPRSQLAFLKIIQALTTN